MQVDCKVPTGSSCRRRCRTCPTVCLFVPQSKRLFHLARTYFGRRRRRRQIPIVIVCVCVMPLLYGYKEYRTGKLDGNFAYVFACARKSLALLYDCKIVPKVRQRYAAHERTFAFPVCAVSELYLCEREEEKESLANAYCARLNNERERERERRR